MRGTPGGGGIHLDTAPTRPSRWATSTGLGRWLGTIFIVVVVLTVLGQPAPWENEHVYMSLLKAAADPNYLVGDWTFGSGFLEKGVFNAVFSPAMQLLDIEALSWIGRVITWVVSARLLIALGERLGSRVWTTVLSVSVLVAMGWSMGVGAAGVFGHFAAMAVATPLALGAFVVAMDRRIGWTALLVGLSASFHPAVGLWFGGALIVALLIDQSTRMTMLKWLPVAVLASLPGLILEAMSVMSSSFDSQSSEFLALARIPHHVDPFAFGERGPLIFAGMVIVVVAMVRIRSNEYQVRLMGSANAFLLLIALAGIASRLLGFFDFLLIQPFRGLATLLPLTFFLMVSSVLPGLRTGALGRLWNEGRRGRTFIVATSATLLAILLLWNPVLRWQTKATATMSAWTTDETDLDRALVWLSQETELDSVIVSPPWVDEIFYLSERPQFVSWEAVTYDRPVEWRERLELTTADPSVWNDSDEIHEERLAEEYAALSLDHWVAVSERYDVDYVVTNAVYPVEPVYQQGEWSVYSLADAK